MDIQIHPGTLRGELTAPPSKSAAHRAAICAALAPGESRISGIELTQDMIATMDAATALGAVCRVEGDVLHVRGVSTPPAAPVVLDCNESGSTLRFFVPIAAARGVTASFTGRGKLPQRPMEPLVAAMSAHDIRFTKQEGTILSLSGKLTSGRYEITGSVSSQYITGLLFALPLLEGDSEIALTSPLQSAGYVDMTLQMLEHFGVSVDKTASGYAMRGGQQYQPQDIAVEGDFSAAAFWLCAGALHSDILVKGLSPDSLQGDRAIIPILVQMGADIQDRAVVRVRPGKRIGLEIDAGNIPDLVPALAAVAAYAEGETVFTNAARLRIKECDRLDAVATGLSAMGAAVECTGDSLRVTGQPSLPGGVTVDSFDDHRIAMAMSIAALGCERPVIVRRAECVNKSYPGFYRDFASLGGNCHVL